MQAILLSYENVIYAEQFDLQFTTVYPPSLPHLNAVAYRVYTAINYSSREHMGVSASTSIWPSNKEEGEYLMATLSPPIQDVISLNQRYLRAKRALDLLFTLLILPFLCLVMVIAAVLIRIDSQGPALFRQRRVGQDGVEFEMYKFRSMHVNIDDAVHREAVKQYINGNALNGNDVGSNHYKLVNDSRVTRIGRIFRKTSIDELPQFINVLRGEMSLVGPRPPLHYEVEEYSARDRLRLSGKPGLTGTWQVYGRSRVPFGEMIEMDINYLQQQSILQDIKLIAITVPVMIMGRGGA